MERTDRQQSLRWRESIGRLVAVALTVGGVSAAAFAPGIAGAATGSTISTTKDAKLGTILVSDGNAVYTLTPGKTACDAKCLKVRPPVLLPQGVTKATAGNGVDEAKLGTVAAADGALQVTYNGKALYLSAKDKSAGQARGVGSDKYGKWATVVTVKPSGDSGTNGDENAGTGGVAF